MSDVHYLAYGSNLLPRRLIARVSEAHLLGIAEIPDHRMAFRKIGSDGSGKCDLVRQDGERAWGAVYRMSLAGQGILDAIEGPDYRVEQRLVSIAGQQRVCFCYFAREQCVQEGLAPFDWYHALVLAGARHHDLPSDYQDNIARVETRPDPDRQRSQEHQALLASPGPDMSRFRI